MMIRQEPAAPDGTPTWLKARKKGIGGSDVAALFGVHPWMSPYTLFLDKTVGTPDRDYNAVLEVGHALEPLTRRLFMGDSGRVVTPAKHTFVPEAYPWMRGNIDGDQAETAGFSGLGVFEGKTTNPYMREAWENEGAPLYYMLQVTHYMICTGRTWGSIAVLVLGQQQPLLWQDVELDQEFAEMVIEAESVFWHDHVLADVPPEIDGHTATKQLIKALHPNDNGVVIPLEEQVIEWGYRRGEYKALMVEHQAEVDKYENRIKNAIGDATVGELPDGTGFSWKTQARKESITKASTSRVLRFHPSAKALTKVKAQAAKRLSQLMKG